jgi:hypothetical protein
MSNDWIKHPLPDEDAGGYSGLTAALIKAPNGQPTTVHVARRQFKAGEPTGLWRESTYPYGKFTDSSVFGWVPLPTIPSP